MNRMKKQKNQKVISRIRDQHAQKEKEIRNPASEVRMVLKDDPKRSDVDTHKLKNQENFPTKDNPPLGTGKGEYILKIDRGHSAIKAQTMTRSEYSNSKHIPNSSPLSLLQADPKQLLPQETSLPFDNKNLETKPDADSKQCCEEAKYSFFKTKSTPSQPKTTRELAKDFYVLLEEMSLHGVEPVGILCDIIPACLSVRTRAETFKSPLHQKEFIKLMLLMFEFTTNADIAIILNDFILNDSNKNSPPEHWCYQITLYLLANVLIRYEQEGYRFLIAEALNSLNSAHDFHYHIYERDRIFVLLLRRMFKEKRKFLVSEFMFFLSLLKVVRTDQAVEILRKSQDNTFCIKQQLLQNWISIQLSHFAWSLKTKQEFTSALVQLDWNLPYYQKFLKHLIDITTINTSADSTRKKAFGLLSLVKDIEDLRKWDDIIFEKGTFEDNPPERTLQEIFDELKRTHQFDENTINKVDDSLLTALNDDCRAIQEHSEKMKDWKAEKIKEWREKFNKDKDNDKNKAKLSKHEVLAVIRQACFIIKKHHLRNSQLVAILVFLKNAEEKINKKKGRILQIKTGEGKSLIIACLAAYLALKGSHKVDIVTSSYQLAERDQSEWQEFYSLFGLQASHNNPDKTCGCPDKKIDPTCYSKNIVYGDAHNFEGDHLRQVFFNKEKRGSRPYDIVIVDEVDSMLLDEGATYTMLSSSYPGSNCLTPLLAVIWHQLHEINDRFFMDKVACDDDDSKYRDRLCWSMQKGENPSVQPEDTYEVKFEDRNEFIEDRLEDYSRFLIENPASPIKLPKYLQKLAIANVKYWVHSAVLALQLEENRDYVISKAAGGKQKIAPVDYRISGVVRLNTVWENGLHQFLQIKHNLEVESESLTGCFLSNVSFFQKYSSLLGLTGTIGCLASQKLLAKTYSLDIFIMPTYKPRQFIEFPLKLAESKEAWGNAISAAVEKEIKRKRSVLILCLTIEEALALQDLLVCKTYAVSAADCVTFLRDDVDKNKIDSLAMTSGKVLIATNLAGRGVDLKVADSVEKKGGLHVIFSFLPANARIEMQGFGRTARQGRKGSGQIIIDYQTTREREGISISTAEDKVKECRDSENLSTLSFVEKYQLPKTCFRDELFESFQTLHSSIKTKKITLSPIVLAVQLNSSKFTEVESDKYMLEAATESYAVWLKEQRVCSSKKSFDTHREEFKVFANQIKTSFEKEEHVENPIYFILSGYSKCCDELYNSAISSFNAALSKDCNSFLTFSALYNRAYALIQRQQDDYKQSACRDLKNTKTIIENDLIPHFESMLAILGRCNPKNNSTTYLDHDDKDSCTSQVLHKISLLRLCVGNVDHATQIIENAKSDSKIIIKSVAGLRKVTNDMSISESNLSEIQRMGLLIFFEVEEKKHVCWWGIIGMFLLGAVQIVAGGLLTAFGAPNLGIALIGEGFSDVYKAIEAACKGESIDWTAYGMEKAISLTLSIATAGWGAVKQGFNVVKSGAKKLFNKIANKTLTQAPSRMTKDGLKLAAKAAMKEGVLAGAEVAISHGFNALATSVLDGYVKQYKDDLSKRLRETLSTDEFKKHVKMILAVSSVPQSTEGFVKIRKITDSILKEEESRISEFCSKLTSGITQATKGKAKVILTLAQIGIGLIEVNALADKFASHFEQGVKECKSTVWHEKKDYWNTKLAEILTGNTKEGNSQMRKIIQNLKYGEMLTRINYQHCIFSFNEKIQQLVFDFIENNINKVAQYENQKDCDTQVEFLMEHAVECFLIKFTSTLQGKVISPAGSYAMGKINKNMRKAAEAFTFKLSQDLKIHAHASDMQRRQNDLASINNRQQPPPNKHASATSPLPTKTSRNHNEEGGGEQHISPEVSNLIDSTMRSGEGGVEHLGAVSHILGQRIEVYIDGKREITIGDNYKGKPLKLALQRPEPGRRTQGHWSTLDPKFVPKQSSGINNCMYDSIGSLTGMSAQDLRNATARYIRQNAQDYHAVSVLAQQLRPTKHSLLGGADNEQVRRQDNNNGENNNINNNINNNVVPPNLDFLPNRRRERPEFDNPEFTAAIEQAPRAKRPNFTHQTSTRVMQQANERGGTTGMNMVQLNQDRCHVESWHGIRDGNHQDMATGNFDSLRERTQRLCNPNSTMKGPLDNHINKRQFDQAHAIINQLEQLWRQRNPSRREIINLSDALNSIHNSALANLTPGDARTNKAVAEAFDLNVIDGQLTPHSRGVYDSNPSNLRMVDGQVLSARSDTNLVTINPYQNDNAPRSSYQSSNLSPATLLKDYVSNNDA